MSGVEGIVVAALGIVAQAAPGVLAGLASRTTDEEAIEAARARVASMRSVRVSALADARREEIEREERARAGFGPAGIEAAALAEADRRALVSILSDAQLAAHLGHEQRAALRRLTGG